MKLNERYTNWIKNVPFSDDHLALFRIVFACFYLFSFGGIYRYDWMATFPSFFYQPPLSLGTLFDSFPSVYVLHGINVVLPLLGVFVLMGFKTRYSSLLLGLLLIVNGTFLNSFGKISHSHLVPFTALIFAFSSWGKQYSVDAYLNRKRNIPFSKSYNVLPMYALIIAFAFFTSGFSKLVGGWLQLDYQATRYLMCVNAEFLDRYNLLTQFFIDEIHSVFIWECIDYCIVFIELLPLCVLFYPKVFRHAMFFLATFHIGVYLILNISFGFYPLLYLIFIVQWKQSPLIRKITNWANKKSFDENKRVYISIALFIYFSYIAILYGFDLKGEEGLSVNLLISLFASYVIVLYFYIEPYIVLRRRKKLEILKNER